MFVPLWMTLLSKSPELDWEYRVTRPWYLTLIEQPLHV